MSNTKISLVSGGDIEVSQEYFDGSEMATMTRTFRQVGAYVHQVFPNGSTSQTCEGLRPTGNTLMSGDDLTEVIRKTLA